MGYVTLNNGAKAWSFSSSQYVQAAVKNVEDYAAKRGWKLPRAQTPISTVYRPELDVSRELNNSDSSYYQSLIGLLRWIVELGCVDVNVEVSKMSSHLALPRQRDLKEVFHIFAYLKEHHNGEMVFDSTNVRVLSA